MLAFTHYQNGGDAGREEKAYPNLRLRTTKMEEAQAEKRQLTLACVYALPTRREGRRGRDILLLPVLIHPQQEKQPSMDACYDRGVLEMILVQ